MKIIFSLFLFVNTSLCFAQPRGDENLYICIVDGNDTLHFENTFKRKNHKRINALHYQNYQLISLNGDNTGFEKYPQEKFIYSTAFANSLHLLLIKNDADSMRIEIKNCIRPTFILITFIKGNFKINLTESDALNWDYTVLPTVFITQNIQVYNFTPKDWKNFEIKSDESEEYYFISKEYSINQEEIIPPQITQNFIDTLTLNLPDSLKYEEGDYNFDGFMDYRIGAVKYASVNDYFLYNPLSNTFEKDTLLSSLAYTNFDFVNSQFYGYRFIEIADLVTQLDFYTIINNQIILYKRKICRQEFRDSEKSDCQIYELENGKLVFKAFEPGAE